MEGLEGQGRCIPEESHIWCVSLLSFPPLEKNVLLSLFLCSKIYDFLFALKYQKHKILPPITQVWSGSSSSTHETCYLVPTAMLCPAQDTLLSPLNSSAPGKFPILHSHPVSCSLQPLTASASVNFGIKGISNGRVGPVLGKRPLVPTRSTSGLHVVLGLWSSVERFGENKFIFSQQTGMNVSEV